MEEGFCCVGGQELFAEDGLFGRQQGNVGGVSCRVAVDKVEDAVRTRIDAGGNAGPRNFGLGRGADFQRGITACIGKTAQVSHFPGGMCSLEHAWVERIEPEDDRSHLILILALIFAHLTTRARNKLANAARE